MLAYWLLFAILGSGAMLQGAAPDIALRGRPFLVAAGVIMALMIGLRYEVGPDWVPYSYIFEATKSSAAFDLGRGDPAFYLVVAFVHRVGGEIWLLNLICGSIFVYGLFAFARRQWSPWLSVLVVFPYLCIVVAMSGTRQAAAIGFFFLSLNAFRDKSFVRFFLYLGLGALFHASAVVMGPICALSFSRSRVMSILLVGMIAVLGYYTLSSSFDTYVTRYGSQSIQSTGVIYRVILNVIPALLFFRYKDKLGLDSQEIVLWRNFAVLAFLSVPAVAVISSSTAVDRLVLYLFPLQSLVFSRLPWLVSETMRELRVTFGLVILYAGLILLVYLTFSEFGSLYIPYQMFFLNGEATYVPKMP